MPMLTHVHKRIYVYLYSYVKNAKEMGFPANGRVPKNGILQQMHTFVITEKQIVEGS